MDLYKIDMLSFIFFCVYISHNANAVVFGRLCFSSKFCEIAQIFGKKNMLEQKKKKKRKQRKKTIREHTLTKYPPKLIPQTPALGPPLP